MKKLLLALILWMISSCVFSQTANFILQDDSQKILCYTGNATRNTTASFRNKSTGFGDDFFYVWNFGDSSIDSVKITKTVSENASHEYRTDGLFTVKMFAVSSKSFPDSIKNATILNVDFISNTTNDSVNISVTYKTTTTYQSNLRIPKSEFARKTLPYDMEVYSPYVSGNNFKYEIDDPSTESTHTGIESFVYIFNVNTENFKPHKTDMWKYYWSIYDGKTLVKEFDIDSLEYRYTFPRENYNPGYNVTLKIALDSSKFEDQNDLLTYDLAECVASQTIPIKVTDYFYDESSRTNDDIDDRKTSIPNVFTPGGNDENEVFYFNTNGIDTFTLWIYNNNGTLVYKQVAKTISWTGVDNSGHECQSGTYYYVVKSTNGDKRHNTAGHIQLFRQN